MRILFLIIGMCFSLSVQAQQNCVTVGQMIDGYRDYLSKVDGAVDIYLVEREGHPKQFLFAVFSTTKPVAMHAFNNDGCMLLRKENGKSFVHVTLLAAAPYIAKGDLIYHRESKGT